MPPACRSLAASAAVLLLLVPAAVQGGVAPACTESGIASYYGPGFHGRPTASGEIFDSMAMTAAHPTLPLGTAVEVRLEGGDAVVEVLINDRGPYVDGRIIDLSQGAAEALGMVDAGIAPVILALYPEDQSDPDIRLALLSLEGLPVRRPSLLRLGSLRPEALPPGRLCPEPPPQHVARPAQEPPQRGLLPVAAVLP